MALRARRSIPRGVGLQRTLAGVERMQVELALKSDGSNKTRAAEIPGIGHKPLCGKRKAGPR